MNTTSWGEQIAKSYFNYHLFDKKYKLFFFIGNGFNNTYYGQEHNIVNVSCLAGKSLTVGACFYGINSASPGCAGSTVSANCLSMDVSSNCSVLCNTTYCYFAIENYNFGDTCNGIVKTFWMYFTCA
jgi:hypothetical protein